MSRKPTKRAAPAPDSDEIDPAEAARLADEAIKQMLRSDPETHEAMVKRKHRKGEIKRRSKR